MARTDDCAHHPNLQVRIPVELTGNTEVTELLPNHEETISAKTHHMRVDYSMFEGIQTKGAPKTVFSRGRAVIDSGKFVGRPGADQFLRRQT
ncbi:MAG TPA: hypothetical protein VFN26_07545 [Candidatus Acidoferrum sp.]|nr:hypothetical protein [Candidatus Acidoferrum sp.]